MSRVLDRRQVLRGATLAGSGLALSAYMPAWAQPVSAGIAKPLPTVSGDDITLKVAHQMMMIDGRQSHAIGINGTVPAPLILAIFKGEIGSSLLRSSACARGRTCASTS